MEYAFISIIGLLLLVPSEFVTSSVKERPIEIKVEDEKVQLATDVTLTCNVNQQDRDYLKVSAWFTDDGLIFISSSTSSFDIEGEATPRQRQIVLSNGNLFIYNINQRDVNRKYRCQILNTINGERIESTNWAQLIIKDSTKSMPPIITSDSPLNKYYRVEEGETLLVGCPIIGIPRPTIKWYQYSSGGREVSPYLIKSSIYPDNILIIHRASQRDAGKYQCIGNNTYGHSRFDLHLLFKRELNVIITSNNPEPIVGQDIILNCSLNSSQVTGYGSETDDNTESLIKEIKWFKNMSQINHNSRISVKDMHTLIIRSFRFNDNGVYQCFIKTHEFDGSHHERWYQGSIKLSIPEKAPTFGTVFPEQIKISGSQLSLKCLAFGQPIPSIRWKIDGKYSDNGPHRNNVYGYMTSDGKGFTSFLNISSLTIQDGGTYKCIVENPAGVISHEARIDIIGGPGIKPMDNMTAIVGQTYQLYCPYIGYPVDQVYFTKGNRRLPFEERQLHVGLGKINILSVSKEDAGFYKCIVSSLNGERYESGLYLHVIAPPILSPFSFPSSLEEGMRISIMCSVISGDPPISIVWLKNGSPLGDRSVSAHNPSIHLVSLTEYVSSLIIENLSKHDSGNYTCLATNPFSSATHSALLSIKSKPHFTLKPISKTSVTDAPVLFNCQAEGYPAPVIRWKFSQSGSLIEPAAILSSPRIHVLENGSLYIRSVTTDDEGHYHCEASNGLGKLISLTAYLKVFEPPKIRPMNSKIVVRKSEKAEILCQTSGSLPMIVEWFKNGNKIFPNDDANYGIREDGDTKYKITVLSIHTAQRNDSALFVCNAINFYGNARSSIKVIVQETCDPPNDLHVIQAKATSVSISWSVPFNGNSPILGYQIEYRTASETWSSGKTLYISETSANTALITDLSPSTSYYLRIAAENSIGRGEFSQELFFITRMEAPKVVPENITAVPLDSKSVKVTWIFSQSNPFPENGHSSHRVRGQTSIDGFYIGHKPLVSQGSFTYNTLHVPEKVSSVKESSGDFSTNSEDHTVHRHDVHRFHYTLHSLRKSTKYAIVIQAFNKEGEGPYSDQVIVETFANDPPKAPKLSFESSTIDSASLTWSVSHSEQDSIHGFILSYRSDKSETDLYDDIKLPKNYRRYLLSNLLCGTKYSAKICAFNEVAKGESSFEIRFSTEGSAPLAPDKSSFISSNITMATLWLASWSDGKCPIDHFEIQYKPSFQPEWILLSNHILPNHDKIDVRDIMPGTWYDLLVTAKNEAGTTEVKYLFATLDVTGATVSPLLYNDSKTLLEGLMILIPSISAIIVLLMVAAFAIYIVFLRPQRNPAQGDIYGTHQGPDSVSLHSYNKAAKSESMYDHQRIYCTSVYNSGANEMLEIRDNPGQLCSSDDEYRFMMENRVPRKGLYDHIYDVPHRHQKVIAGLH